MKIFPEFDTNIDYDGTPYVEIFFKRGRCIVAAHKGTIILTAAFLNGYANCWSFKSPNLSKMLDEKIRKHYQETVENEVRS